LTLSQFNTNSPDFEPNNALRKDALNRSYYAQLNIPTIQLTKEFSPLIGIDMKLKNDFSLRADFKKAYNLQMSFFDNQLMEQKRKEYTIGIGYKMKNVHLKFLDFLNFDDPTKTKDGEKKKSIIKFNDDEKKEEEKVEIDPKTGKPKKKKKKVKKGNDLTMKCDFSLQDNVTYNNQMDGGVQTPTRGELTVRISPSADYMVNKRLTLRFFVDYNSSKPKTSLTFPRTNVNGGLQLRFSLQ
jgi:cell surface protein SprA